MAAAGKAVPKDAQVMAAILKDMGVNEYEPRVIHQMLDFAYRYVTDVLDDARFISNHASKKSVDVEDVKLAVQLKLDCSYTAPPPRELLMDIARFRNNQPLPLIKPYTGPRLPPDRYCLSATNYKLRALKKPQPGPALVQRIQAGGVGGTGTITALQPSTARIISQQSQMASTVAPRITVAGAPVVQVVSASRAAAGVASAPSTGVLRPASSAQPNVVTVPATPTIRIVSGSALSAPPLANVSVAPSMHVDGAVLQASAASSATMLVKQEAASPASAEDGQPAAKRRREQNPEDDYDI